MTIRLLYPTFWAKRGILSFLLLPFSWLYRLAGFFRSLVATPIRFPAKTICIGNATVGGTGKTQIVLWLIKHLQKKNISFLVITKGYNSNLRGAKLVTEADTASDVGDESVMLSKFSNVVAAKNIASALPIVKNLTPEIIIFDDGMQNPNFIKDINILVIDSHRGIGNGMIFPSGPLRESIDSAIEHCDIIITTGNDTYTDISLINSFKESGKQFMHAQTTLVADLDKNKEYYAFAAIGNPQKFYDLLISNNITISKTQSFPDHHLYTSYDILHLIDNAKKKNLTLITTKKDYVKISDLANRPKCNINIDDIICASTELKLKKKDEEKIIKTCI